MPWETDIVNILRPMIWYIKESILFTIRKIDTSIKFVFYLIQFFKLWTVRVLLTSSVMRGEALKLFDNQVYFFNISIKCAFLAFVKCFFFCVKFLLLFSIGVLSDTSYFILRKILSSKLLCTDVSGNSG